MLENNQVYENTNQTIWEEKNGEGIESRKGDFNHFIFVISKTKLYDTRKIYLYKWMKPILNIIHLHTLDPYKNDS